MIEPERPSESGMTWPRIVRIGLVQASIGAVVVMLTSTVNRVMIVELALPAAIPGVLIALHFAIQFTLRPGVGHRSDLTGRREWWIMGGLLLLALSGTGAAASAAWIASHRALGMLAATVCFLGVGAGVSAAGTPLLAILAERVAPARRPRAAAVVWLIMIGGFIATTALASHFLAPFSWLRLVQVTGTVGAIAFVTGALAVRGLERGAQAGVLQPRGARARDFRAALREVLADPEARAFCWFLLLSMLAYSAQDLLLEPFTGIAFGATPAESTRISSMHRGGILVGMLAAAALAVRMGTPAKWASAGCVMSALCFALLAGTPALGSVGLAKLAIVGVGIGNGVFCIGALSAMMALIALRSDGRAGLRMGVYGGVEAVAMGAGGLLGALANDAARTLLGSPTAGYVTVLALEGALFAVAAAFAVRSNAPGAATLALRDATPSPAGDLARG